MLADNFAIYIAPYDGVILAWVLAAGFGFRGVVDWDEFEIPMVVLAIPMRVPSAFFEPYTEGCEADDEDEETSLDSDSELRSESLEDDSVPAIDY